MPKSLVKAKSLGSTDTHSNPIVREIFEQLEAENLAPYAVKSTHSLGRHYPEPPSASRTCFQRDRDRIIHSKAFRRLKHKTQVFVATDTDHYRSRLTHTLEVAQISRHLARMLRLNEDLAECLALAHDLGHPPFGHAGEKALHQLMKEFGGFEHNIQSLRVVEELENKYPTFPGLNLSLEVRDGLKKHETPWDCPPETNHIPFITLEAQVVNVADEIAYNNHDLDDGLSAKILTESELTQNVMLWKEAKAKLTQNPNELEEIHLKTLVNSSLISTLIDDVVLTTKNNIQTHAIQSVKDLQSIKTPIVAFSSAMKPKNLELRKYLFAQFYSHHSIYKMNKRGQNIIRALFEAFVEDQRLLPDTHRARITDANSRQRVVCDYIAGMTDGFALKEYETLF